MMKHLLENKKGMKIAIIVNDLAELNIDASLIGAAKNAGGEVEKMENRDLVELQNGCICCNLREDLLVQVYKMATKRKFDYLVIESSGICEPKPIAETFAMKIGEDCGPAMNRIKILNSAARLDTMVSVVDCHRFHENLQSLENVAKKFKDYKPTEEEGKASVADLLIEQVEYANVIVLNKIDLMKDEKELALVRNLVKRLNPVAKIYETTYSKIDPSKILNTGIFEIETLLNSAGWLKEMTDEGPDHDHAGEFGITSFVYKRRKPFHPERLFKCLDKSIKGVMRSKGYSWIATRHNRMAEWNNAGRIFRIEGGGPWFDANVRFKTAIKQHPQLLKQPQVQQILNDFVEPYGDRRQELVIIGENIDEKKVTKILDDCLLTEAEFKKGPKEWRKLKDSLPKWEPLPFMFEDDEEEADESHLENLRFKVGDRVECCVGTNEWAIGKIVKLKYRGPGWPKGRPSAPYQIKLDSGALIFAPFDDDRVVRAPKS